MLLNWLLSALSLLIVANVIPGFQVSGFVAALIAALVIGLVNSTLGVLLKIITFPFLTRLKETTSSTGTHAFFIMFFNSFRMGELFMMGTLTILFL